MYAASKDCFQNQYWLPTAGACSAECKKLLVPASHLPLCCAPCSIPDYGAGAGGIRSSHKLPFCLSAAPSSLKLTSNPAPSLWLKAISALNLQTSYQTNLIITPLPSMLTISETEVMYYILFKTILKRHICGMEVTWGMTKEMGQELALQFKKTFLFVIFIAISKWNVKQFS